MLKNTAIRLTILAAALFAALPAHELRAQSSSSILSDISFSPYSLYGLGDPVRQGTTYSLSMGGIGIGDRNVRYINLLNPAALPAREAKSFMMDFGVENRNTIYQGNAASSLSPTATGVLKSASNTTTVHHIVASFPIESHSAFKVGIMPYSSVAYNFRADETSDELISEMGDIQYYKEGKGGLYQAFIGAGVTLWDRVSLGADFNYFFGKIDRSSSAYFTTNDTYRTLLTGTLYHVSCFGGKFGFQYTQPIGNASAVIVGATYALPMMMRGNQTRYAYGETLTSTDSIVNDRVRMTDYSVPGELGTGITYHYSDRVTVGFDYVRQDWRGRKFEGTPGIDFEARVAQSFRAGLEITPNRYDIRYFMRRLSYRIGAYHEQSYIALNGHQVTTTGFTLGIGIPVYRYYNSINVGFDFGQRGTLNDNLVRERYFLVTVSFNLHDIWFIKPLYN